MKRDYLDLISSYHRGQPNFTAIVDGLTSQAQASIDFLARLPEDFDLDEAIGAQLDVDGEWIGRSRFVAVPLTNFYFSFDDADRGLDKGIWKGPFDTESGITRLDDETYRRLLRAKILANQWDGTVEDLKTYLFRFFDSSVLDGSLLLVEDKLDMSYVIGIAGHIPDMLVLALLARGYLPLKPAGVKPYYIVTSIEGSSLFGFDVDNAYIHGFGAGVWGVTAEGILKDTVPLVTSHSSFYFLGF